MVNARAKGHTYELKIVNEWKALLHTDNIWTSRNMSKIMDDLKVDLVGTDPFYIQCKAFENAINSHGMLFEEMPQKKHFMNLLFHKRDKKELVSMKREDFFKIFVLSGVNIHQHEAPKNANIHKYVFEDMEPSKTMLDAIFMERKGRTVVYMKKKQFYEMLKPIVDKDKWGELE